MLGTVALGATAWVGWATLPIAVVWLASGLVLWRAYPALLLQASAEHIKVKLADSRNLDWGQESAGTVRAQIRETRLLGIMFAA